MALTKETVLLDLRVEENGSIAKFERTDILEDGVVIVEGPRTGTWIYPGDDVANETQLVKDVVNGNLHSQERKDAGAAELAAKASEL